MCNVYTLERFGDEFLMIKRYTSLRLRYFTKQPMSCKQLQSTRERHQQVIKVPDMTYNVFSGTLNPTQSIVKYRE